MSAGEIQMLVFKEGFKVTNRLASFVRVVLSNEESNSNWYGVYELQVH